MARVFSTILLVLFVKCYPGIFGSLLEEEPIVNISAGDVLGYLDYSTSGKLYYGFRAIPYAKAPIGRRRFKPPEPIVKWNGTFDARHMGNECPQYEDFTRGTIGDEDCLNINVYTSSLFPKSELPVIVWIHGGCFTIGAGLHSHFGPQNWMDLPIVLVTFNYRLGVLGFLSTEDEQSFGNYGMLDQVMALKWVQKNIRSFGGNPKQVTIMGESAGSVSVTYHLLSKLSKGLFQRAVAQSGTVLNHWAFSRNPLKWAQKLAERVECHSNNTKELVECLRSKPSHDLVWQSRQLQIGLLLPILWAPSKEYPGGSGFLTEDPVKMLERGKIVNKVPVLMGMMKCEGDLFYSDLSAEFPRVVGRQYFQRSIPQHLPVFSFVQPDMNLAVKEIIQQYYADANLQDFNIFDSVFSEVIGDAMFAAGISKTAESLAKFKIPTYVYLFSYIGEHCLAEYIGGSCENRCPQHGDELFLQFRYVYAQTDSMTENDAFMSSKMNKLWVDFASKNELFIDNNVKWSEYNFNRTYVELNINSTVKNGLLSKKMNLWTETLPELAKTSISRIMQTNLKFG